MTNYERIKQMSIDEIEELLSDAYLDGWLDGSQDDDFYRNDYSKEWLESEAEQ